MKKTIIISLIVFLPSLSFSQKNIFSPAEEKITAIEYATTGYEKYNLGEIDSCLIYFDKAEIQAKKEKDWNLLANTYSNIFAVNSLIENFEAAAFSIQKTEKLLNEHLTLSDSYYPVVAGNIGAFYQQKRNYSVAMEYFKKALSADSIDLKTKGNTIKNIGDTYNKMGDWERAMSFYQSGITLLSNSSLDKIKSYLNNGAANVYFQQEKLDSAKIYFLKSLELIDHYDVNKDLNLIYPKVNNLNKLTDLSLKKERFDDAKIYLNRLDAFYKKYPKIKLRKHEPFLWHSVIQESKGNLKSTLANLAKAKKYSRDAYPTYLVHPSFGKAYQASAELFMRQRRFTDAIKEIDTAIPLVSRNEFNGELQFLNKVQGIDLLEIKATALDSLVIRTNNSNFLKEANIVYGQTSRLILSLRTNVQSQASELNWSQRLTKIYQSAVKNAISLYQKTNDKAYLKQAFYYSECNKAATLAEKVSYEKTLKSILPEEKWKALQDLRIDIAFYQKQINGAKQKTKQDSTKIAEWTQIIEDLEKGYEASEKEIKENYPEYANAVKTFKPSTVEEIRNGFLQENTALVEYFSMEDSWYIFTLTKDDLTVEEVKKEENFELTFNALVEQISQQPKSSTYVQGLNDFANDSHVLYELLLAQPLQDLSKSVNSLMIIPDGELTYFPFELLLTEKPAQELTSYSASVMPYLFNDYNISYGFSATVVNLTHQNTQQIKTGEPAIFAPAFSSEYIAENRSCHEDNLSYLQCNATEGERINGLVSGDIFTGDLASIQQFREAASNAPILHLATHACVDEENEDGNKIFFADTYLTNEDLNTIGVNADLVVLSACDTGLGKLIQGEGLMSLSRGFLCAGAASTVMSLWSVDDCATSDLMVNFYQELKDGNNKSTALKNAKLNYLNQADKLHQHPYFWAPFVLSGNVEPIESVAASSSLLYMGIGGVVLLLLTFFGYWKMKN